MFPRSRWTRSDEALDFLGLLASCHNLLEPFIIEMTGGPDKQTTPVPVQFDQPDQTSLRVLEHSGDVHVDELDEMMKDELDELKRSYPSKRGSSNNPGDHGVSVSGHSSRAVFMEPEPNRDDAADEAHEHGETSLPVMSGGGEDWAAERKKNKKKAKLWAQTNPGPRLVLMKQTLAPLMRVMLMFLHYTGQHWERKQKFLSSKGEVRSYRILLAHLGVDVQQCINELANMLLSLPRALMSSQCTSQIRALNFKLIARALCYLHTLLRIPRALSFWKHSIRKMID